MTRRGCGEVEVAAAAAVAARSQQPAPALAGVAADAVTVDLRRMLAEPAASAGVLAGVLAGPGVPEGMAGITWVAEVVAGVVLRVVVCSPTVAATHTMAAAVLMLLPSHWAR